MPKTHNEQSIKIFNKVTICLCTCVIRRRLPLPSSGPVLSPLPDSSSQPRAGLPTRAGGSLSHLAPHPTEGAQGSHHPPPYSRECCSRTRPCLHRTHGDRVTWQKVTGVRGGGEQPLERVREGLKRWHFSGDLGGWAAVQAEETASAKTRSRKHVDILPAAKGAYDTETGPCWEQPSSRGESSDLQNRRSLNKHFQRPYSERGTITAAGTKQTEQQN